jgi:hypothetical protein
MSRVPSPETYRDEYVYMFLFCLEININIFEKMLNIIHIENLIGSFACVSAVFQSTWDETRRSVRK